MPRELSISPNGSYIVLHDFVPLTNSPFSRIHFTISPRWVRRHSINGYFYSNFLAPMMPGLWFKVKGGSWPTNGGRYASWEGYPMMNLALELGHKERRWIKMTFAAFACDRIGTDIIPRHSELAGFRSQLMAIPVRIDTRSIQLSTKDLTDKVYIAKDMAEAIRLSDEIRNIPKEPEPTRWHRLGT